MGKRPLALWISLAAFGAMTLIQLLAGVRERSGVLLAVVALNVVVLAELWLGHKWAYVAMLILALGDLLMAPGRNVGSAIVTLVGNGLVIVPLVISFRFFFPDRPVDVLYTLKRFWPLFLIAAGLFLYVGGFMHEVGYAGIPYQDPTPEMSADYAYHAHIASTICRLGTGVFLFGVLCGIIWFGIGHIRRPFPHGKVYRSIAQYSLAVLLGLAGGWLFFSSDQESRLENVVAFRWRDGKYGPAFYGAHVYLVPIKSGYSVRARVYIGRGNDYWHDCGELGQVQNDAEAIAKWGQIEWREDGLHIGTGLDHFFLAQSRLESHR